MKKKIISCVLSAAMLFSVSSAMLNQNVFAQALSAAQQAENGKILFPNDVISFDSNSKIIYKSSDLLKEVSVGNKMVILPNYSDIFQSDISDFYGWRVSNDTINTTSGKRTSIELTAVFIKYDTEKSGLNITFPEGSAQTTPSVLLIPKTGYKINSLAEGISYNAESNILTLSNIAFDADGNINLNDTYTSDIPSVTLYKDGEKVTELSVCPQKSSFLQFTAKVEYPSGVQSTDNISWSLNDDVGEFISIDNNGLVTVTPYFTGADFTVIASVEGASASAKVTMEHSYGEWKTLLLPTETEKGIEVRTCACGAQETRDINPIVDTSSSVGSITLNGQTTWSALLGTIAYNNYCKFANITIAATNDDEITDISYYISDIVLTKEQLDTVTAWTSGKEFSVTSEGKFIVYAKITDKTSKISYISSDGIVVDSTAPVISGLENGKAYYGTKTFTVTEANLKSVLVNDVEITPENGIYTLSPETLSSYTIRVTDMAGNEAICSGYIYPEDVSSANTILGITENATYRRGSVITFTATGYGMDNTQPADNDIRFVPVSYSVNSSSKFTSGNYTQAISTSNFSVGTNTLSVLYNQQVYSAVEGWKDTGITDTKSIVFRIENREEIESTRANPRASFFTVKFETNGGTMIDYVLVDRLKYVKEPVSPTKVGYKFDGWYTDKNLTDEYDFSQRVTSNMTLYAKWTKTSSNDNIFSDVSEDDWYYDNIAYVYATGLMNGTGDAEFSPDMPTTRAMIVTILYRLEGEPSTNSSTFSDVSSDSYYAKAVSWAQENKIVNGISSSVFAPNKEISREQLMTILYRYAEYKDYDRSSKTGLGDYTDSDQISAYATDAFQWAVATKVASGRNSNFLSPKASATRAEVASAFRNFIEGNKQ